MNSKKEIASNSQLAAERIKNGNTITFVYLKKKVYLHRREGWTMHHTWNIMDGVYGDIRRVDLEEVLEALSIENKPNKSVFQMLTDGGYPIIHNDGVLIVLGKDAEERIADAKKIKAAHKRAA